MELKDFIKETLLQIASGARLADDEYRKLGNGGVNPEGKFHLEGIPHILCPGVNDKHDISKPVVSVQFKLNVQIEEKTQIEGKIGGILKRYFRFFRRIKGRYKQIRSRDFFLHSRSLAVTLFGFGQIKS